MSRQFSAYGGYLVVYAGDGGEQRVQVTGNRTPATGMQATVALEDFAGLVAGAMSDELFRAAMARAGVVTAAPWVER